MYKAELLKQKKRNRIIGIAVVLLFVCVLVFIFLWNNQDVLLGKKQVAGNNIASEEKKSSSQPASVPSQNEIATNTDELGSGKTADTIKTEQIKEIHKQAISEVFDSITITSVVCKLVGASGPRLWLSMVLTFKENDALKKELLFKRDDVKVMLQGIVATKTPKEILVDDLREAMIQKVNALLEKATIEDIRFTEFRIDKVE